MLDIQAELRKIEDSLKEHRLPVRRLCAAAEIAPSTWTRWKSGKASPTISTLEKCQRAATELLAQAG